MKCMITNMTMEQNAHMEPLDILGRLDVAEFPTPRTTIKAEVILLGDPKEAYSLSHLHRELEIRPIERFEKEDKKKDTFEDVRKGDEIRYQFIRGAYGNGPEESQWMKVIAVDGDMLTAVFNQDKFKNKYEFRVLRCQIIDHKCAKKRMKIRAQERIDIQNLADPTLETDAVRAVSVSKQSTTEDPVSDLRNRVKEFNLT